MKRFVVKKGVFFQSNWYFNELFVGMKGKAVTVLADPEKPKELNILNTKGKYLFTARMVEMVKTKERNNGVIEN